MTLVIDLKRALREPEYRAELCEELECGVSDMVMEEAADRIDALENALREAVATITDYVEYQHDGDPWTEDARAMGEMDINDYATDGRLADARALLTALSPCNGQ